VNAEFNWWLLIVGLVLGAALTWLVMAESTRRDADVSEAEQRGEALWIASMLSAGEEPADAARVERILRLHREYLAAPPPDEPDEPGEPDQPVIEAPVAIEGSAVADAPSPTDLEMSPDDDATPEVVSTPSENRP